MAEATKRDYSQKERDQMDASSFAGPHESFPINSQADVDNAARLIGHADNPDAVKAKIIEIARRKGFDIPDAWKQGAGSGAAEKALGAGVPFSLVVPITKVDLARREVWGVAAVEQPDKSGEIFDYATSWPHFRQWSQDFEKRTGGKSLGNVRAMHKDIAAGKLIALKGNDAQRQIEVGTKVVDDNEWRKVEEGVYTGFSIGGSYADKWSDKAQPRLTRYTAKPSEISLVDNPCIPGAVFTAVKSDGSTEVRKFATSSKENTAVENEELAKSEETEAETEEITYDDGRDIPADFGKADKGKSDSEDAADAKEDAADGGADEKNEGEGADAEDKNKAKKDYEGGGGGGGGGGDMAMAARLDGLEKVLLGVAEAVTALTKASAANTTATDEATKESEKVTKVEKVEKAEADGGAQPIEGGDLQKMQKLFESQAEELRKATETITQLETRLEKLENEPVPGGPFLTGEALLKAGKVTTVEKRLDPDLDGGSGGDADGGKGTVAELTKMMEETNNPLLKEEIGKLLFERAYRERLGER